MANSSLEKKVPSGSELINFLAHHQEKARASEEALRLTVETGRGVVLVYYLDVKQEKLSVRSAIVDGAHKFLIFIPVFVPFL